MVQILARKPKVIAWCFLWIFYLQLLWIPVAANTGKRPLPAYTPATWKMNTGGSIPVFEKIDKKIEAATSGKKPRHGNGVVTTGPTQPETQSFQSVNANNLVDLFTGDFSYNIPLLDVGGYPVNLHYQSGITMDQEASWVGLGWNINPGVVTRNMRGLPDDFMGEADKVTKTISIKPNKTFGVTVGANKELLGFTRQVPTSKAGETVKGRAGVLGASLGVFHNTYKGWGTEVGLNANINAGSAAKGPLSAGLGITNNSQNGFDLSPSVSVKLGKEDAKTKGNVSIGTNYNSRSGIQNLQLTGQMRQTLNDYKKNWTGGLSHSVSIGFARPSYTPTISIPYTNAQISFTAKVGSEHWAFHPNFYVRGYSAIQQVEDEDKTLALPAYGYLYYDMAGGNRNVLLDFNREKDVPFSDNSPHIAVPVYTYDTWSISGEGTGGSFRAYRGDIGYIFDHAMATKSNSKRLSIDLGFGNIFHAGIDYNQVNAFTRSKPWEAGNTLAPVIPFKKADTTYENVYFKNPGEKTAVDKTWLQAIGNDTLMRVDLSPAQAKNPSVVAASRKFSLFQGGRTVSTKTFDANSFRKARDRRTQVISYLNANEARTAGLDPAMRSYGINAFPATNCISNYDELPRIDAVRQAHHISEISVLNADGRRYIYGIPVYNISQTEVSMSTQQGDHAAGSVDYSNNDNSKNNKRDKDAYYNRETLPPYAHSFLLSGILSSDYVDITGDGITEDDNGDAVKFNYSRIYKPGQAYKWRAPYQQNKAAYNEGLKTDSSDERGSFTYGEREVWYLNSIESKTMIATFVLETDTARKDAYGVKDENGGQDTLQKLYRLKQINLYTKADYLKNGLSNAKPVKTVHFEYSYDLCKMNPGSRNDAGKLTLTKVWFSYNKNNKGKRNPYVFTYNAANPDFSQGSVDRWGNYKNPVFNPGSSGEELTNADYPYALQKGVKSWNDTLAADSAAPWTLSQIKLPSGARVKVSYESDDYAYVQNRRAMQLFSVAGFGSRPDTAISAKMYVAGQDFHYVFIDVPEAAGNKADITRKYLEGVNQLYFKLAVSVPADRWGKGFEFVPVYAEIEDYGVRAGTGNKTIWIKVKPIKGNESPFVTTALQFLRLNLPSKAYPFSEPGDNVDLKAMVGMLASAADNVKNAVNGFGNEARNKKWCQSIVTGKSFARLDNPYYKKLGGGLRVKKVEVYDNWNAMSGKQESFYGQTYTYTDTVMVDSVKTCISSGVATYEPMIGNDENPFRVPQRLYAVKVGALVPADYMYTEEPFAETFFPAPMIGYSRVRVQSVHKDKKSANGLEETGFYTAKDFPVIIEYTPIDDRSKKTYNPKINNFLNFDARHYVTVSQGFKIELNDMNGKLKSQASYSQNDLTNPISYTYNYYRVKNDNAAQPKLSNTVWAVDTASGKIDTAAEIGKEVELMIDLREETSFNISASLEVNADFVNAVPPVTLFSGIPLPSMETNRYRAIAVLKIVNRYGILDSVIHNEKGSQVTTRNLLYDGETGDVLLSQTNNEFDDPVYNFSYPAHWAYSGMGSAYKNIGTVLNEVYFRKGIMHYKNGSRVPVDRYFESGDELLVNARDKRIPYTNDHCSDYLYYQFEQPHYQQKIWAIDAARGKEEQKGIYFIDRDGIPYSADDAAIKIVRSGKRNMPGVSVGAITSLRSPVKTVSSIPRLVFDSTTGVIAASAARFKDVWKVDSTTYAKDTLIYVAHKMDTSQPLVLKAVDNFNILSKTNILQKLYVPTPEHIVFEGASYYSGGSQYVYKSWLKFDFSTIPKGAVIKSAVLNLYSSTTVPHINMRSNNSCVLERLIGIWPTESNTASQSALRQYFDGTGNGQVETGTSVTLGETTYGEFALRDDTVDVTAMAQGMLDDFHNTSGGIAPAMRIQLISPGGLNNGNVSRLAYNSPFSNECDQYDKFDYACKPQLTLNWYLPCQDQSKPTWSSTPTPGYYCTDYPVDSFVCKPNINDTAVNFYRFGMLGNWRLDRAYTYYSSRQQTDAADTTNIRTDGEISGFAPYWSFTDSVLSASTDTTRWVWNSEMTLFNSKGQEIENHDPLNRYNAGQYGYNQTLPVAVAQNARNREIAFDGFEDYGYQTDTCKRCAVNRHIDLGTGNTLVDTVSHSGLYSLRVGGNATVSKTINIGAVTDTAGPSHSLKEDSVAIVQTTVNGEGTGLSMYTSTRLVGPFCVNNINNMQSLNTTGNIDHTYDSLPSGVCRNVNFDIKWEGYIQPRYTGTYTFYGLADNFMSVYVNERNLTQNTQLPVPHDYEQFIPTDTITLQAGELYRITVLWTAGGGFNRAKLEWKSEGVQPQGREVIPVSQLYPLGTNITTAKSLTTTNDTAWCVRFKNPTITNGTLKRFSPLQGRKVVVSAWAKQETACITGSYNAMVELAFNDGSSTTKQLNPVGNIIEGWQLVEDTLTIPATATSCTFSLKSTSSSVVFFDDVRIQPFNANMKSFVYNPVNLRLAAELDENNYATFYEYDDDGTLIRVKKETERGIKTIKESRSALLKE